MSVITSDGSKVYHESWCPYALRIEKKRRHEVKLHKAINSGNHACKFCFGLRGEAYRAKKYEHLDASYDEVDNAICVKTDVGFWKAKYSEVGQDFVLYHMNGGGHRGFNPKFPHSKLARGCFHRQKDVRPTPSLEKIYQYIKSHDRSHKVIREDGYQKLPRGTKLQRRYYEQAKKRQARKNARRVDQLLEEIQNGSQNKKGA